MTHDQYLEAPYQAQFDDEEFLVLACMSGHTFEQGEELEEGHICPICLKDLGDFAIGNPDCTLELQENDD